MRKGGSFLATTWIKPLHVNKGKTIAQTITDRTDYAENPDKTRKGELVTGHECQPQTADAEFLLSKQEYVELTGRVRGRDDILAYHVRQAFKPGEITPELANKLGQELAMRFTRGNHAFIVATHIDRQHIHNHIVFNSTTLDCTKKFRNPMRSNKIIRRISDQLCVENGLSIIENPKPSKGHYGKWLGDEKPLNGSNKLRTAIDEILTDQPSGFADVLRRLEDIGFKIKYRGKRVSILVPGQKRYRRLDTLKGDHTEAAIMERIAGKRVVTPRTKITNLAQPRKLSLLIDIQNSIKAQNSPGYAQWAKIFNLKEAAQTLIFLQENSLDEMEKLQVQAQAAKDNFNDISGRIQAIDKRLPEISELQKHIGTYSKTREVYAAYRKAGYSKKYLTQHEDEIARHKAAKQFFDGLGLKKLPSIKALQTEYATLVAEKKKLYAEHKPARKFMQDILAAQQNAERLLGYSETSKMRENERA